MWCLIDWCSSVADWPAWWANVITAIVFIGIAMAVFVIPRSTILREAPDNALWRDYRLWAVALVIVQLGIYAVFA